MQAMFSVRANNRHITGKSSRDISHQPRTDQLASRGRTSDRARCIPVETVEIETRVTVPRNEQRFWPGDRNVKKSREKER